jgi:hypothetical protein
MRLLFILVLLLCGCAQQIINRQTVKAAEVLCQPYGGWVQIRSMFDTTFVCHDGTYISPSDIAEEKRRQRDALVPKD